MWITCWLVVMVVLGAGPAAAQSAPTLTRIAFGSCAHQERAAADLGGRPPISA